MNLNDMKFSEVMELKKQFENFGMATEEGKTKEGKTKDITQSAIGKWVIVRSVVEGINFGLVEEADETGIVLSQARRLWRHSTPKGDYSWYEGVSISGLSESSRISVSVSKKIILEDYSITFCTEKAIENIRNKAPDLNSCDD